MAEEPKQDVVDNLVGCAVSLGAFYIVDDMNTKLSLVQQVNKEYSALSNKLQSGNISDNDLNIAVLVAKERIPSEIGRKDELDLDTEESKKLEKSCPSKADQLVNYLKQKRTVDIDISLTFKEPEE